MALSRQPFIVLFLLLALFLRAAVPTGFMPEFSQGKIAMTICHGAGTATIWMDVDQPQADKDQKPSCPFTPLPSTASFDAPVLASAEAIHYPAATPYIASTPRVASHAHRPAQPRAPPILL